MPTYKNGYIPESLLVTFAEGANTVDGTWKHQLSPGTYAKHLALVKRSPGGRLGITPGWGAYRPYSAQVVARRIYGTGAAVPGTSSHGGFWEGRQTLAIDYHNWGSVYGWDQARWFADCRAVGLTPGMIMRSRGYPDEPWHVIDLDPWAPAPAGFNTTPFEEDDMPTAEEVVKALLNFPAYDGGPTVSTFFKNVDRGGIATQVWWGSFVDRAGEKIPVIQELADTKTLQLGASSGEVVVDVDEVAIAAALAPLLTSNLGSLPDADVARLAAALADEQARRLSNG